MKTRKEELEVGDIIMIEYGYSKAKAEVTRLYKGDIYLRIGTFPIYYNFTMESASFGSGEDWYFLRRSFGSYIKSLFK
jgi:hypothetical protein